MHYAPHPNEHFEQKTRSYLHHPNIRIAKSSVLALFNPIRQERPRRKYHTRRFVLPI